MFRQFFDVFLDQHFSKKWTSDGSSGPSARLKSIVYWSSSYEVFTKIRVFQNKFPSNFQCFRKTLFSVFPIQTISSKENSDFWTSFWALFLLCGRWFLFFSGKHIYGNKQTPDKSNFRPFLIIFVQVAQYHFFRSTSWNSKCFFLNFRQSSGIHESENAVFFVK